MLTFSEKILFIVITVLMLMVTYKTWSSRVKLVLKGQGKLHFDNIFKRSVEAFLVFVTQKTVFVNRPIVSFIHALVAWAFTLYILVNVGDILAGYIPGFHFLGTGLIGKLYRIFVDIFSVLAIVSVFILLIRRFFISSKRLAIRENVLLLNTVRHGVSRDSLIVGFFIMLHIGFRFIGETFTIRIDGIDEWQPLASFFSGLWKNMDHSTAEIFQHISWWLAIGLILCFIPYFAISKHAHLFMGPFNFFSRPKRLSPGTLEKIDFEKEDAEQFGVSRLEQLEKKLIIDSFACIMCNRCQDVCPAYVTGKELSPSALEINKRYFINKNAGALAAGKDAGSGFVGNLISESALWACTSCAACAEICPVGNEPIQDILNVRRDRVLTVAEFPRELQNAFNGMERNGNPWNMGRDRRTEWFEKDKSLSVKTVEENPNFEYLYWVGCAGAYDERGQQIARSFAKILNKAGINFAVLGINENCTGDSARRAGNEYLFSVMAEANIEMLNSFNVKKIIVTCPHCLQALKNDYQQFGGKYEVIHHSEFIKNLIESGKLNIKSNDRKKITYHDPCYLGRHNEIFSEPRFILKSAGADLIEMDRTLNRSFCCGAGGANMWKEEEPGNEATRQNRLKEAHLTVAQTLCTGCPFCITMLTDASNELDMNIEVKDIAELVAEKI